MLWLLPDMGSWRLWAGLGMTGLNAYLVMELSNRNSLLRIRSRMMSAVYLVLMAVCPMLHAWNTGMIPTLCFLLSYFTLFSSYQKVRPEGYIFHSFLFAGIGSLFFPPMLVVALAYYVSMLFQLRNFRGRTFMAGLIGLLTPYWVFAAYAIWQNRLDRAFLYLLDWIPPFAPDYNGITQAQWVTAGCLLFFALLAFIHFFHTAYNDKIRTRMFFYVVATQEVVLVTGLVFFPQHLNTILGLFIANSSLLIAHYYALGKGRFFPFWFNVSLAVFVALGVYNYVWGI